MDEKRVLKPMRWLIASTDGNLEDRLDQAIAGHGSGLAAWRRDHGLIETIKPERLQEAMASSLRDTGTALRVHAQVEPTAFDRILESAVPGGEEFRVGFIRLASDSFASLLNELAKPDPWVKLAWLRSGRKTVPDFGPGAGNLNRNRAHEQAFAVWAKRFEAALGSEGLAQLDELVSTDPLEDDMADAGDVDGVDSLQDQAPEADQDWRKLALPQLAEGRYVAPSADSMALLSAASTDGRPADWPERVRWTLPDGHSQQQQESEVRLLSRENRLKLELRQPVSAFTDAGLQVWLYPRLSRVIQLSLPAPRIERQNDRDWSVYELEVPRDLAPNPDRLVNALRGTKVMLCTLPAATH